MADASNEIAWLTTKRNLSGLMSLVTAGGTAVKLLKLVSIGLVTPWASSLLLLVLLGVTSTTSAKLARLQRLSIASTGDAISIAPSGWSAIRSEMVCYLWFVLAVFSAFFTEPFHDLYQEFDIALNAIAHFMLNAYVTHLWVFIGFAFLTALALAQNQRTRRKIQLVSFAASAVCALMVVYAFGQPLFSLLRDLS